MDYNDSRSTNGVLCTVLERCIKDILSMINPLEGDRNKRLNTIDELAELIQSIGTLKGATVKPFGSFVSNLYSKWGDLDISITLDQHFNSSASRRKKQNILREVMRALRNKRIGQKIQLIPQARVPLLVYESRRHGVSCDVSIDNHQGRVKSKILQLITSLDERFTDMVLLIKEWAKAQNINDPKTGTLNSYSLCLLVIFHLQTCEPVILPPLKEIYDGNISDNMEGVGTETEREIEDICALNVQKIISCISGHRNQSPLTNLLLSFFDKFSEIEALSSEYVICTFTGRWERMANNPRWTEKSYNLFIEDPFEQPDNAARAVGPHNLRTIAGAFQSTRQLLSSSSVLSDRSYLLHILSRPLVSSRLSAPKKPIYTHQQLSLPKYPNMNGTQQVAKSVGYCVSAFSEPRITGNMHAETDQSTGYCVSAFAEPSHNQVRTTRITRNMHADTDQLTGYCVSAFAEPSLNQVRTTRITGNVPADTDQPTGYCVSAFAEPSLNQVRTTRITGNMHADMDQLTQLANGNDPSRGKQREKLAKYCEPSHRLADDPVYDPDVTLNHRNYQVRCSAQFSDRFGQDCVVNLNDSNRTGKTLVEPKRDNLAPNCRNSHVRFVEQTPERFDRPTGSGSVKVHRTGVPNVEPTYGPSRTRNHERHQLVGYQTTSADVNGMMHRTRLADTEPITRQLDDQLKLNGRSYGSRSTKGKQIWQPKVASSQVFPAVNRGYN